MEQDYGAAQPIADVIKHGYDTIVKYLGDPDAKPKGNKDTVDHDWIAKRAQEATASFAKKPEDDKKALSKRTLGGKKTRVKKGAKKKAAKRKSE